MLCSGSSKESTEISDISIFVPSDGYLKRSYLGENNKKLLLQMTSAVLRGLHQISKIHEVHRNKGQY